MKNSFWFYKNEIQSIIGLTSFLCLLGNLHEVESHGRLIEPPSRSSAWRYGFNTTRNYNDHELYCGGFSNQYQKNNGKCGICGDAYDTPQPRPNEAGGVYGTGLIVRKYQVNSIIRIKVELTANHKGFFEFRLCPNNNPKKIGTQKCLDINLLQQSNGQGSRYYPSEGTKVFDSRYLLPKRLTCTQCILQWRYIAGNNWGQCDNGTHAIGCGAQEEFRACADVSITDTNGHASAEEDETIEDNEIDTRKLEGGQTTTPILRRENSEDVMMVWPFVMSMIGLMVAAIALGALFGWFYRKEVLQFARARVHKPNWKIGNMRNNGFIATTNTRHLSTFDYPHITHHPEIISGRPPLPPPVPPPRNKKTSTSDLHLNTHEDYQHRLNGSTRRVVTPDVISHPLSLTINGLAV